MKDKMIKYVPRENLICKKGQLQKKTKKKNLANAMFPKNLVTVMETFRHKRCLSICLALLHYTGQWFKLGLIFHLRIQKKKTA